MYVDSAEEADQDNTDAGDADKARDNAEPVIWEWQWALDRPAQLGSDRSCRTPSSLLANADGIFYR
jgi:hypothetical protein